MKILIPLVSAAALALTLGPACLYFADIVGKPRMQSLMLVGTILWFASAPLWLGKNESS
jgi:hypothetical protein